MERNIVDVGGSLLLVPQFTLGADVRKGTRASFHPLAEPQRSRELFEYLCASLDKSVHTAQGAFGAHMQVALVNDGPVTFLLQT
ncbi:MAG: D-aminoacyl-tRNA deacylase [Proteobacteria bacterium]|nr:D-aminoacyl-tRNA deacylase [Pseudomonadota bacterium]